jgi:hypothetical protein
VLFVLSLKGVQKITHCDLTEHCVVIHCVVIHLAIAIAQSRLDIATSLAGKVTVTVVP